MPLKTLRYVIIEADTRALEFFLALFSFIWSAWLSFGVNVQSWPKILDVLHNLGGYYVWVVGAVFQSIYCMFSLYYNYPRLRRSAACIVCFYWSLLTYCIFNEDSHMLMGWITMLLAGSAFIIVTRRYAIKPEAE